MKKIRGFTLTEVMITVVILGIIATISVYSGGTNVTKTRVTNGISTLEGPKGKILSYYFKHNSFPTTLAQMGLGNYRITDDSFDTETYGLIFHQLTTGAGRMTTGAGFSSTVTNGVGIGFMIKPQFLPDGSGTAGGYIGIDITEINGSLEVMCTTCDTVATCGIPRDLLPRDCYRP